MLFQTRRGCILIAVGDVVPQLIADELGKEATGVGGADDTGMFGGGQKGASFTVAFADQPLPLCLLEEGEEPRSLTQIFGYDVLEGWRQGGAVRVVCARCVNASTCA